jgi:hypothetical protein
VIHAAVHLPPVTAGVLPAVDPPRAQPRLRMGRAGTAGNPCSMNRTTRAP